MQLEVFRRIDAVGHFPYSENQINSKAHGLTKSWFSKPTFEVCQNCRTDPSYKTNR